VLLATVSLEGGFLYGFAFFATHLHLHFGVSLDTPARW
jgi:hypothetical protein